MNDTSPQMTAKMREKFLSKSSEERLRLGCSMYDFSKQLVVSAILRENPNLPAGTLRLELFQKFYGNDFDVIRQQKIVEYLTALPTNRA